MYLGNVQFLLSGVLPVVLFFKILIITSYREDSLHGVVVVVFFTLTDRASTIPSNTRGCQSGTWSAGGQKKIRGTYTKLQRDESKRKTQTQKRQRERNRNNKIHRPEKDKRGAFDRESLA